MKTSNHKPFAVQRIKTKDLWQTAFMLAKGSQLQDLRLSDSDEIGESTKEKKQKIIFVLTGKNISHLKKEFQSGQAVCRVRILKSSLMHLKDEMLRVMHNN